MSNKPALGGKCGDTHPAPAGVYNQGSILTGDGGPCPETTTHTLRGQPLCRKHWQQGLDARRATDSRMAGYRGQLRNYQR